jgi:hypothetical protein
LTAGAILKTLGSEMDITDAFAIASQYSVLDGRDMVKDFRDLRVVGEGSPAKFGTL